MTPEDYDERTLKLADLAEGSARAIAKQIIETFPALPSPQVHEMYIRIMLTAIIQAGVLEAVGTLHDVLRSELDDLG